MFKEVKLNEKIEKKLLGTLYGAMIFSNPLTAQEVHKALREEKKDVSDNSENSDVQHPEPDQKTNFITTQHPIA